MRPVSPCSRVWAARATQAHLSAGDSERILSSVKRDVCIFHQRFPSATWNNASFWKRGEQVAPSLFHRTTRRRDRQRKPCKFVSRFPPSRFHNIASLAHRRTRVKRNLQLESFHFHHTTAAICLGSPNVSGPSSRSLRA